jgi:hypothetical protein
MNKKKKYQILVLGTKIIHLPNLELLEVLRGCPRVKGRKHIRRVLCVSVCVCVCECALFVYIFPLSLSLSFIICYTIYHTYT